VRGALRFGVVGTRAHASALTAVNKAFSRICNETSEPVNRLRFCTATPATRFKGSPLKPCVNTKLFGYSTVTVESETAEMRAGVVWAFDRRALLPFVPP